MTQTLNDATIAVLQIIYMKHTRGLVCVIITRRSSVIQYKYYMYDNSIIFNFKHLEIGDENLGKDADLILFFLVVIQGGAHHPNNQAKAKSDSTGEHHVGQHRVFGTALALIAGMCPALLAV